MSACHTLILSLCILSTRAYTAIGITGEYPTVLPSATRSQAVGYDKTTQQIIILGGNSNKAGVAFNINDQTFEDLGTDYIGTGTSGDQHYVMLNDHDLWMINNGGTGFLKMNLQTRTEDVPSTEFPLTVSPHACLAGYKNQYLFVIGGWNSNQMLHTVQIYDIHNNVWINQDNIPLMQESRSVEGCIVNNNKLYVIAGLQSDTVEYIYIGGDLNKLSEQQEWKYVDGLLPTTLRANTVVNYGDKIIILGGRSDTNPTVYNMQIPVVDTAANKIEIEGTLSYPACLAATIIVDRRIYIFGGESNDGDSVDSYQYIDLPLVEESKSISVGSVLLIVFFVSIVLYCAVGYGYNGHKGKDWGNVKGNIPQFVFWKTVPLWIIAGCKVTYEFLQTKVNGGDGQPLMTTDVDDGVDDQQL